MILLLFFGMTNENNSIVNPYRAGPTFCCCCCCKTAWNWCRVRLLQRSEGSFVILFYLATSSCERPTFAIKRYTGELQGNQYAVLFVGAALQLTVVCDVVAAVVVALLLSG